MYNTKFYLTKKGLQGVQKEYFRLLELRKRKVQGEVPQMFESQDINPEYVMFKEDMGLLENRIREYEVAIKNAQLILPPSPEQKKEVSLGATVTLEEKPGDMLNEYTVVGTLEANPAEGKISCESPVGRALLGKKIGEKVVINSPINVVYEIRDIRYFSSGI